MKRLHDFTEAMKELRIKADRFISMQKTNKKLIKAEIEIRKVYSGRWNKK